MSLAEQAVGARALDRRLERGLRARVLGAHEHEAVVGADGVAGERHALEQQRRVALHQVLVDVGAGVALVAVGDDELRARPAAPRANSHFVPAGKPAPPRPRTSAALTASSSSSGVSCVERAAQARTSRRAREHRLVEHAGQHRLGRGGASRRRARARRRRARRRSTSPSRTAGEAWQKPRQTVSASETEPSSRALAELQAEPVAELRRRARRRSRRSRRCRCRRARGARRAAAAGRRRRSRRRRPPPRAGPSARRRRGGRRR